MDYETINSQIGLALDLLQLVTEEVEDSFIGGGGDSRIKARAVVTVSALYILGDFLRSICADVTLTGDDAVAARGFIQRARDTSSEFEGMSDGEVLSRLIEAGLSHRKEARA